MRRRHPLLIAIFAFALCYAVAFAAAPQYRVLISILALAVLAVAAGAVAARFLAYLVTRLSQAHAAELASQRHLIQALKDQVAGAKSAIEAERGNAISAIHELLEAERAQGAGNIRRLLEIERERGAGDLWMAIETERTLTAENIQRAIQAERENALRATKQMLNAERERAIRNMQQLNVANSITARPIGRFLAPEIRDRLVQHWAPLLGVAASPSSISYVAHNICVAEDRCIGRLAAPIETALLRHLAMRSLGDGKIEALEIGTLFGVAAGLLYRAAADFGGAPSFTLLDPMAGYYGDDTPDPLTGMPVNEQTLKSNLRALGVPDDSWRLIKRLSTDTDAVKEVGDREYDLLLIDGDHSLTGVKADYNLYGALVKAGGLLIFDDYDTKAWPEIKPYVDSEVVSDPRWTWLGAEYGTAILRRNP